MDHNVYCASVGAPPRGPEPLMVYYDTLRRLRERKADFSGLFPGHGRYGISPDALDDAVENLRQIHEREGEESPAKMAFGLTGTRHQVGTSLIYYSDEYAVAFRACGLVM